MADIGAGWGLGSGEWEGGCNRRRLGQIADQTEVRADGAPRQLDWAKGLLEVVANIPPVRRFSRFSGATLTVADGTSVGMPGWGSVVVSGGVGMFRYNPCQPIPHGPLPPPCYRYVYESGTVSVTVGGIPSLPRIVALRLRQLRWLRHWPAR